MDFVAIDLEKLDDSQLSVCEVGMVKYQNGKLVDEFHSYIKPAESMKRNLFGRKELKHITDEMLLSAPTFSEIYSKMKEFANGALFVCHNKGADLNYLYYNEKAYGLSGLYTKFLDTSDICKLGLKNAYQKIFGKQMENHHFALDDAKHTAEILMALSEQSDVSKFVKSNYIPEKEKPKSDKSKFNTVSSKDLPKDDILLANFDFIGKICVISGASDKNKESLGSKLEELGAKVTTQISGKTDVFIKAEKVGSTKLQDAKTQKEKRPDPFHIFTQEGVAKVLGINLS